MCIAVWTLDHPDYALILADNRDEFLSRPTLDAQWHSFDRHDDSPPDILSGRDAQAGGTWFGVNRAGKVAVLTNITEPIKACSSSRGSLTANFLLSDSSTALEDQATQLVAPDSKFAGFNLLLFAPTASGQGGSLRYDSIYTTNHGAGGLITSRPLSAQEKSCGCVSNAVDGLNAEWVKVRQASSDLDKLLERKELPESELVDQLFHLLSWRSSEQIVERGKLRNTVHVAPFRLTIEGIPLMVDNAYGTRLSTVLLIRRDGQALFIERDMWKLENGELVKQDSSSQRIFRFQVNPNTH